MDADISEQAGIGERAGIGRRTSRSSSDVPWVSWRHRAGLGLQSVWYSRGRCQIRCRSAVRDGQWWWCGWRCRHIVVSRSNIAPRGSRQWQVWTDRRRCLVCGWGIVVEVVSVEVFVNRMAWWSGNHRDVLPEKLPVPERNSPWAINSDHVLIKQSDLNNGARLVPFALSHQLWPRIDRTVGPQQRSPSCPICWGEGQFGSEVLRSHPRSELADGSCARTSTRLHTYVCSSVFLLGRRGSLARYRTVCIGRVVQGWSLWQVVRIRSRPEIIWCPDQGCYGIGGLRVERRLCPNHPCCPYCL